MCKGDVRSSEAKYVLKRERWLKELDKQVEKIKEYPIKEQIKEKEKQNG